jgi:hypothetical protein
LWKREEEKKKKRRKKKKKKQMKDRRCHIKHFYTGAAKDLKDLKDLKKRCTLPGFAEIVAKNAEEKDPAELSRLHFHFACDLSAAVHFGVKITGKESGIMDVYFDKDDTLQKQGFWLRSRFAGDPPICTWALIETLLDECGMVHYCLYSDPSDVTGKLVARGWDVKQLNDIPKWCKPIARFMFVRHNIETTWGRHGAKSRSRRFEFKRRIFGLLLQVSTQTCL